MRSAVRGEIIDSTFGKGALSFQTKICAAIRDRRALTLRYGESDQARLIEPHALGISGNGEEMLVAWQLSGPSRSGTSTGWKNFRLSELKDVAPTDAIFEGPRPGYSRDTVQLAEVRCQL